MTHRYQHSFLFFFQSGVGSSLTAECQLKTVVSDRVDQCLCVKSDLITTSGVNEELSTCSSFLSVW